MRPISACARRHWRLLAVFGAGVLTLATWIVWGASQAVDLARADTEARSLSRATVRALERPVPDGVQQIDAPSSFRDAAVFNGHLFAAGAAGLVEYDDRGSVVGRMRPGIELPPVQIVSVTTGVLAASPQPELVIATAADGLLRYDGTRLRHVQADRPEYGRFTAALWLGSGRLLLGTDRSGPIVYSGGESFGVAHPSLAGAAVTALAGTAGDVWIGTVADGVLHWRGGNVNRLDERAGLPDRRVLSLAVDGERAFVGTPLGIAEFRGGEYVRTLGDGLFAAALAVAHDTLLVGTLEGTIVRIPLPIAPSRGVRPLEQTAPAVIGRFVETGGSLYAVGGDAVYEVGGGGADLRRVAGGERASMSDRNVSAVAVDASGRLWVGYFDRGLDILGAGGERAVHVENDHVFCVNRIVHDAGGGLTAVATANGLVLFDSAGRQRQILGRADGLIANHVTDLVIRDGAMTLATPAGLTFLDSTGNHSLYAFHGLVNNHVYALAASGRTTVAGTLGGVSVLEDGVVRASYTAANSTLTRNWVTAVVPAGDDWLVGTYGGGVLRLDRNGRWERFPDLRGEIVVNPNAMAVTATHVFAGTLSQGILVYDRARSRWTTFDRGLPSMNVTALAAAAGGLYVGTDNGIVRIGAGVFDR